jgi:hypothetical protein
MEKLNRFLCAAATMAAFSCAATLLVLGVWMASTDIVDFRGVETNVVYSIIKLINGKQLYTDPTVPPYDVTQYAPLYYLLCAAAARLLGLGPNDVASISSLGRGLSAFCGVILFISSYLFCARTLKADRIVAAASSSIAYVLCAPWLYLARPDALYSLCLFSSLALCYVAAGHGNRNSSGVVPIAMSAILSALAVLSKQTGIQAFVAIVPFLAAMKEWRLAAIYLATSVAVLLLFFLSLRSLLGPAILQNALGGIANDILPVAAFVRTFHPFFSQLGPFVAWSAAATVHWNFTGRDRGRGFMLWAFWLLFAFATVSGFRFGSDDHYYNECLLIWAAVAAVDFTGLRRRRRGTDLRGAVLHTLITVFIIILLPIRTAYIAGKCAADMDVVQNRYSGRAEVAAYLKGQMNGRPGSWFFCEDQVLTLFLPDSALFPQQDVIMYSPSYMLQAALAGYRELTAAGMVRYIVCSAPHAKQATFVPRAGGLRFVKRVGAYDIFQVDATSGAP